MNYRRMWRPKLPECEQCPSCPFLTGNDDQLRAVANRLRESMCLPVLASNQSVEFVREQIKADLQHSGDFICHRTAYDLGEGGLRPKEGHRQCPGASKWWREDSLKKG